MAAAPPMALAVLGLELAVAAGADPVLVAALAAVPAAPAVPEVGAQKRPLGAVDRLKSTATAVLMGPTDLLHQNRIEQRRLRSGDEDPAGQLLGQNRCPPFPGAAARKQF